MHVLVRPLGLGEPVDPALDHPQVRHREMVVEREHPTMGTVRLLGMPVKLSDTPAAIHRTPPLMGQHTDEVLRELGFSAMEIAVLKKEGAV